MGTSKGYKMPSGGDWKPLKTEATDFAKNSEASLAVPRTLLRNYVKVRSTSGGSSLDARDGRAGSGTDSGSGGGGRRKGFSAAVSTAQRLGDFVSRVGEVGLGEALREAGLGDLVGKSASEIAGGLLDKVAGPASMLDQAAAREALVALNDDLLSEAETFEDVEEALTNAIDQGGLFEILLRFYGYYIYQCFCTDFYERFVKQVGSSRAAQSLKSVRDCIEAAIKAKLGKVDFKKFSWSGRDGRESPSRYSEKS